MSRYTLSINIKSDNKDLLDNLMVTLETINGNLTEVEAVELFTTQDSEDSRCASTMLPPDPSITQRNLFLDRWTLSEAV